MLLLSNEVSLVPPISNGVPLDSKGRSVGSEELYTVQGRVDQVQKEQMLGGAGGGRAAVYEEGSTAQ